MTAPTESKVWGATVGGTAGYTFSQFILWVLGVTFWGKPVDSGSASFAINSVPDPVQGIIGLGITVAGVYFGGWFAKHTPRDDPDAVVSSDPVESETTLDGGSFVDEGHHHA